MYLGNRVRRLQAVDNKTVYARSVNQAKAAVIEPEPTVVTVVDTAQVDSLKETVAIQRGRVRKLLQVLRGKNQVIARQEREIAALREPEQLTVDQILSAKSKINS